MRSLFLALSLFLVVNAQADEVADSRTLQSAALAAHREKNEAAFLEHIAAASALRPQHAGLLYQLAVAQALNGKPTEAVATLARVARMGFAFTPERDPDFASLAGSAQFQEVLDAFARNAQPVGQPALAFTLNETGEIAEGLAFDAATARLFVSSVRTKRIFVLTRGGKAKVFAKDLPWGVFGMAVDAKRKVLWAATSALPQTEGFDAASAGKAGLAKIDLATGRVLALLKPEDAGPHLFGDVAVAPNGDVYTTNTDGPAIYRVRDARLEPFARGPFQSLQGIAVARGGQLLYVADYAKGLFAIDVETRDVYRLPVPDATSLLGIDGLYLAAPNTLIATQNGTRPARVLRISLGPTGLGIVSTETLAANDPLMTDVTLGTVHRGDFYFVANAQWNAWDDKGALKPGTTLEPARILRVQPE